ncbi:MAG TPA: fumarylacetoacetate hydrolase family protein [Anaerolineae bacterium]|nr:fumarylacetoacetate hydrolase family protein [Anaerolineae bacterium]
MSTKFVRVLDTRRPIWGIVEGNVVYHLEGSPYGKWQRGAMLGALHALPLLPPTEPTKIICVGRNYAAHAAEHNSPVPEAPLLFLKPPSSVVGPDAAIVLPTLSQRIEHEAELAVVIARPCRDVTPEEAWDYVLGVTCGNDVTARDLQRQDGQWTRGKGFDTFCPLGPWIVAGLTAADIADLAVTCRVNGDLRQQGRTSEMVFSPAYIVSYAAAVMTLMPGDVLLTGTPAGVGPLTAGDVVDVEVEGIGVLRNPVR